MTDSTKFLILLISIFFISCSTEDKEEEKEYPFDYLVGSWGINFIETEGEEKVTFDSTAPDSKWVFEPNGDISISYGSSSNGKWKNLSDETFYDYNIIIEGETKDVTIDFTRTGMYWGTENTRLYFKILEPYNEPN